MSKATASYQTHNLGYKKARSLRYRLYQSGGYSGQSQIHANLNRHSHHGYIAHVHQSQSDL